MISSSWFSAPRGSRANESLELGSHSDRAETGAPELTLLARSPGQGHHRSATARKFDLEAIALGDRLTTRSTSFG